MEEKHATNFADMRVNESVGEKVDRASIEDMITAARDNDVEKFCLLLKMGVVGISDCYAALDEAALYGN